MKCYPPPGTRHPAPGQHVNYLAEAVHAMWPLRESVTGLRMTKQLPFLRHFTAAFEPVG